MKICTRCGKKKPLSEFHKWKLSRDGLRSRCKSCRKEDAAAYRKSNSEKIAEYQKSYKQANRGKIRESEKRYRAENPEKTAERYRRYKQANPEKMREMANRYPYKRKARKSVETAVLNGSLTRPKVCSACNAKTRIEAHHADYAKPLEVTWLCKKCHVEADAKQDKQCVTK